MKTIDNINYDIDLSDGVITFKNINTTLAHQPLLAFSDCVNCLFVC